MAIQACKTLILTLGIALGVTACDQTAPSIDAAGSWRTGVVDNGGHLTLNTNAWIPASARDLHEFRDNGDVYVSSYGYEAKLMRVTHPSTPYQEVSSPAQGSLPPDVAKIRLRPETIEFEVEVEGPGAGDPAYVLSGAELIGLRLSFDMKDPDGDPYAVDLEVVDHMIDEDGNDLYELDRVAPATGDHISLCEQSADYGRFARIISGLHIEGETGDIDIAAPSLRHIGCLASVPAKAMRLGYSATPTEYEAFVLATRVVRADYCADGNPYTYPGNLFAAYDNIDGPQTLAGVEAILTDDQTIEAVWDEHGVLCVGTPRASSTARTDIVCPTKRFADGTVVHNWQPPSCDDYASPGANGLRLYSVTNATTEPAG